MDSPSRFILLALILDGVQDVRQPRRSIRFATVGTVSLPFFQHILSNLVTHQFALLVFDPGDCWMLEGVGIEARGFKMAFAERRSERYAVKPGGDVVNPALQ